MKPLYALVCETQRYAAVLDAVIARAGLLRAEKKLRPHLARVSGGGCSPWEPRTQGAGVVRTGGRAAATPEPRLPGPGRQGTGSSPLSAPQGLV